MLVVVVVVITFYQRDIR